MSATVEQLGAGWRSALADELDAPYLLQLEAAIAAERAAGRELYPPEGRVLEALRRTPFEDVRVVILGQDPYHGPGQATGLAFAVPRGVRVPPSLRNVFTELGSDLQVPRPAHGDLTAWADRGVLLLNTSLTVRAHEAGSHARLGWRRFTAAAIDALAREREHLVFLLWGRHAQDAGAAIDRDRHLVLHAAHPSPLSASKGFFGCRHFSRANEYLLEHGDRPVDWSLPE